MLFACVHVTPAGGSAASRVAGPAYATAAVRIEGDSSVRRVRLAAPRARRSR